MSLTLKNRIFETTTTTGTGAYLLAGVVNASCRPFADVGNGGVTPYMVEQGTKSEWGLGTYSSGGNTLARTTILGNYLGTTAAINWSAGTKNIYSPDLAELFNWLTFSNTFSVSVITTAETSAPSTPASGFASLYVKSDGKPYIKDDAGTETCLISAGSYQPLDATLTAFAALTIAANSLTIGTAADTFSQTTFAANTFPARASSGNLVAKTISDFALTILDDSDAAAVRTTIGAGTGSGNALTSNNLDQFADVTQTSGKTLAITENTTLAGGSHSGTNTGDQNTFSTIAVSGQSNVVADSTSDTLTLVAGSNITITTNAGGDSITIAASGGGGGGDVASDVIWDAKGDLAVGTGSNTAANLAVGSNGQVLSADSGESTGLKWVTLNTDTQNNLLLPATTDTVGQIKWNSLIGIHTYGDSNFFAGFGSGQIAGNFTLTGAGNVGIGGGALDELEDGSNNVAIGVGTLSETTSGSSNVACGVGALSSNTTGSGSVAVGLNALIAATTAGSNTALGYQALVDVTTGDNNAGGGYESLKDVTTGDYNTGFGSRSGESITDGVACTFLGYYAHASAGSLSNACAIGAYAEVSADDTLVLGDTNTGVAIGATAAEGCALLTMSSTSRGLLPPRMTTSQMNAISSPVDGLVIYNTTDGLLYFYAVDTWTALTPSTGGDVTLTGTQTLTNKRITKRVQTVVTDSSVTPDADDDDIVDITALAEPVGIVNPSGTPTNGQVLLIRILDDGTSRAITWGSDYVVCGTTLPTETLPDKHLVCLFAFNAMNALNKWQLLSAKQEV